METQLEGGFEAKEGIYYMSKTILNKYWHRWNEWVDWGKEHCVLLFLWECLTGKNGTIMQCGTL